MWNMMVVEDESIVRIGLRYMIDWERYGVFWKHEASNGEEALKLMEEHDIHIVITDIRMPVMDGIELVRRLKEHYPDVQIIVISSYNDFPYVQEALRLGVVDYLHKPTMADEEVEESLKRLLSRLRKAQTPKSAAASPDMLLQRLLERLPVREDAGPYLPPSPDERKAFAASRLAGGYCLVLFRLEESAEETDRAGVPGPSIFPSVAALIEGFAVHSEGSVLAAKEGRELIWLKPAAGGFNAAELERQLGDIRRNVSHLLHVTVASSASGVYETAEAVRDAYEEAAAGLPGLNGGYSRTVRLAKEYVDIHFRRDISLSECAEYVHVSSGHLSRLFAKETGMNFSEYVNMKKMEHAKHLLRSTNMRVRAVSDEVGYLNPHYFSKLFKEYTGMSPRDYRA